MDQICLELVLEWLFVDPLPPGPASCEYRYTVIVEIIVQSLNFNLMNHKHMSRF